MMPESCVLLLQTIVVALVRVTGVFLEPVPDNPAKTRSVLYVNRLAVL